MSPAPLFAIIDDDEALRQALAELLEVFGYDCQTFDGAESFMAAHGPGRFTAVVTDLNLMGESGLALQRRLRLSEPTLPVIVISAQSDTATRARVLDSGAVAYLTKPINDQVLLRHLVAALSRSDAPPPPAD
ncbi:response regulator transcription factor [Caulobacter soli]|uniref:response regulator transcription factor n=1 Tax=Caulobacter soli TaxID=2708539 RepID=UPI0013ECA943|nr:response regulator [Caulobacter soli]